MSNYFIDLERELVAAAEREPTPERSTSAQPLARKRRARRPRRLALIAIGALILAAVPATAVTGVFRAHREPDGLVRLSERRVIAEGSTPDRGHWQLLGSQSDAGFCLGIRLPVDVNIPSAGTSVSEGCGGPPPGSLDVASLSGGSVPHNALVYGMTPDDAAQVRITTEHDITTTTRTIDDNAGIEGRFFVAELPVRTALGPATIQALDANGKVLATIETPQTRRSNR
jgi:hypothetical protein